ncbi:MAG: DUF4956 domain-containing protein [Deltaproteobacteria bacterium]|nr:DUF4956 domain-containing protein [Deltaproteobacteria bacterium]
MEELFRFMLAPDPVLPWQTIVVSVLLSFALCVSIAWVYVRTHRGLSYSRSFVQALVLGGMVAAILMLAVGNNLARGIGILGTLAIIRFRSSMKDPRDMVFIFASLAIGIAMGVRAFATGIVGTLAFSGAAWVLSWSAFGSRRQFDGLVRFQLPADGSGDGPVRDVMQRHCRNWVLVALREVSQGDDAEHNYHVKLTNPDLHVPFVRELEAVPGIRGVSFFLQDATEEV